MLRALVVNDLNAETDHDVLNKIYLLLADSRDKKEMELKKC